ncbi:vertnin [Plakobranchus ocellatus]|uniref:Vertnin n=1 Tax=Plakobranchus ocellatus TaxID=259542 RepID=A0AAV4AWM7_9GAST|nr:vertnin [Plakobranchus ocellatus]
MRTGPKPKNNANEIDIIATFGEELLSICKPSVYMGMWQLFAAATVLNSNIISVYPSKGWRIFQQLHNRICRPVGDKSTATSTISILWTSSRSDMNQQHWVSNHVIAIVPDSTNSHKKERSLWDVFESSACI